MSPSNQPVPPENQGTEAALESVDPQSVEGFFVAALTKPLEERSAFLDEVCAGDPQRRQRVEALLAAYEDAGSFLEKPASSLRGQFGPGATASLDFLEPSETAGSLGRIGPYEVLDLIGRGGMGMVMRAADPKLNRVVAVKVLAPELAVNPNARRRFLREAQAAAAISHPHVVTIHAVDDNNPPYLVMECIVGQSLQDRLNDEGALPLTEILRIGKQVSEGLAAAHAEGLIHRDIKPSNILLENGVQRVKITDFGLARAVDDATITRTGEVSGTPQYMSPEQARGERLDHRSDMFSLGCVLYAMCTGRSPFRSSSLAEAVKRVTDDSPRPIAEINPELPDWLVQIVEQLLEKNPEARIQSAEQLADLLGRHLAEIQRPSGARRGHEAINADALAGAATKPRPRASARDTRRPTPSPGARSETAGYLKGLGGAAVLGGLLGMWLAQMVRWPQMAINAAQVLLLMFVVMTGLRRMVPFAGRISWPMWALSLFSLMLFLWTISITVAAVAERSEVEEFGWLLLAALGLVNVLFIWLTIRLLSRTPASAADSIWTQPRTIPRWAAVTFVLIVVAGIFGKAWYDGRREPADTTATTTRQTDSPRQTDSSRRAIAPGTGSTSGGGDEEYDDMSGGGGMMDEMYGGPGMAGMGPGPGAKPPAMGALTLFITDPAVQVWLSQKPEKAEPADEMGGMSSSYGGDMGMMGAEYGEYGGGGGFSAMGMMEGGYGDDMGMYGDYSGSYGRSFSGKKSPETIELPAGTYRLHITVKGTGWEKADGSRALTGYTDEMTINPGETVAREISIDFDRLAAAAPDFDRPGLYRFHWPTSSEPTLLSQPQARIVQRLFTAFADETPAVAEEELLKAAFPATDEADSADAEEAPARPESLEALFNDGQHLALGRLIVPAEEGIWRLASLRDQPGAGSPGDIGGMSGPGGTPGGAGFAPDRSIRGGPGGPSGAPLERQGTLVIDLRSTGMLVAVRRKSSFDRTTLSEETITTMGETALSLPPGEYEVLMRDELAGWSTQNSRTETWIVRADSSSRVIVRRDLEFVTRPVESQTRVWRLRWNGKMFLINADQRSVLQNLLDAMVANEPDVEEATLLEGSKYESMAEFFGVKDHPWPYLRAVRPDELTDTEGRLVIPGETKGTWRLSPPAWGTVEIDVKVPGFGLTIPPQDEEGPLASWSRLQADAKFVVDLPVGRADLQVFDNLVRWNVWRFNLGQLQAETSTVTVSPAEPTRVLVDRTPEDLRRVADYEWPAGHDTAELYWPVEGTPPLIGGFGLHLTRDQAAIIRVLLRAYADGQPEVSETELLEGAGLEDRSLEELFPPKTRTLLRYMIAGEEKGTWRLSPLPEGVLNRSEDANEPAEPDDATAPVESGTREDGAADSENPDAEDSGDDTPVEEKPVPMDDAA
ncbi:Serine/threonine-protein kinase PknB [Maioricimonas rarisocia]|uniref:non-specific serine/threonine protein kinase n=1 Tax=Maioricimonas rarisocia TaxID=2528026 RepID=A0A517ZCD4_9PLAN|nr:serine/threonine-protein kinase [Maioricimonas rarisocia]QDU40164.1 Serine/threonine-protein kinase PknB [Maioricimonas rarisocia]